MMKRWITHNIALKIIALGLAIITWIYVNGELIK
jgi:YbbR domain-containing protein